MHSARSHASLRAYERTFRVYPLLWFERTTYLFILTFLLITLAQYSQLKSGFSPGLAFSALALMLYTISVAADIVSTQLISAEKRQFDRRKLDFPVVETGMFLPEAPLLKDHLLSINGLLTTVFFPIVFVFPSVGIGVALARLAAAFSNLRQRK